MTDNEKAFLWSKRHTCSQRNSYLHLVLGSAPQWRPQNLPEIYFILERWSPVSTEEALFLLSDEYDYLYIQHQYFYEVMNNVICASVNIIVIIKNIMNMKIFNIL